MEMNRSLIAGALVFAGFLVIGRALLCGNHVLMKGDEFLHLPSRRQFLSSALLGSSFLSCSQVAQANPTQGFYEVQNQRIFDTSRRSFLPPEPEKLIRNNFDRRVICVGESHTHPLHHRMQLKIIEAFNKINREDQPLAIGLEMFYRQHQNALDKYVFRQGTLDQLKRETDWDRTWGFSFASYCKIFRYAQKNGIRLVGLNAPTQLMALVGRTGLNELPPPVKELLPEVDLTNAKHQTRFMDKMKSFGNLHGPLAEDRLLRMYEIQTLWDEYMADSASKYLENTKEKDGRMIILAGSGHIEQRDGIPDRISRRIGEPSFTVVPQDVDWTDFGLPAIEKPLGREYGDWIFYTERQIEDAQQA